MFSWFFIGTDRRWLTKLLDLLASGGSALIVLPNSESIEVDFNRNLSPDERTTLDSDDVVKALEMLDCTVSLHEYTKWLANSDLFEGQHASGASLTFAAFAAMHPITTFSAAEKRQVVDLLNARREARGVPLLWDVIVVKQA